jgi:uncharacterized protein with HEPN domain
MSGREYEFYADDELGRQARAAARDMAHRYATAVTELLPGWWRHAHPELNLDAIRSIRNQLHDYPHLDDDEVFDFIQALPVEIAKLDLDVFGGGNGT